MSFVAAAFLAGLAALALPWWLHRRRTHSPTARVVGSLMLMEASEVPEQRHRTVRHRLLLACRALLLALLCLTFAQPLLEHDGAAAAGATARPRLIVLDTSMSMQGVQEAAREVALQLIDDLPGGVAGAVVAAGADVTLLTPLDSDHGTLRRAVLAAEPGAARLSFDGLLGRLANVADTLSDEPLQIHLVSDFQATAMPEQFNALVGAGRHAVVLHPVPGAVENWQLTSLTVGDAVTATVTAYAERARTLTVTLGMENDALARQSVTVAPRGQASVTFPVPAGIAGGAGLWARLDADPLPGDDAAYAVVNPLERVPLPVFAGAGAAGQAAYLRAALEASGLRFDPASPDVRGRVAVLLDPGVLDGPAQRQLARHLGAGGSLLLTAGPATERAGRLAGLDLGLQSRRLEREVNEVAALERSHPVLDAPAWRDVRVYRHVSPAATEAGQVLVSTDAGLPLLLELPLGSGRALLLTTALDPEWSNLVASAAFVDFVTRALAYLAEDWMPESAIAGVPLAVPAPSLQVFDAGGARLLALEETVGRAGVELERPGIYRLRTPSRSRLLAVNVDRRESDPAPAPPQVLERWQRVVSGSAALPPAAGAAAAPPRWALAPWLLALLLALGLLEAVSANLVKTGGAAP